jgi:hypothetical protein
VLNSAPAGASDFDAAPLEAEAQGLVAFACAACDATTSAAAVDAATASTATASWSALLPHLPVWSGYASAEAVAAFSVWLLRCCAQDAATAAAAAAAASASAPTTGEPGKHTCFAIVCQHVLCYFYGIAPFSMLQ